MDRQPLNIRGAARSRRTPEIPGASPPPTAGADHLAGAVSMDLNYPPREVDSRLLPRPELVNGGLRKLLDSVPGAVFQYEIGPDGRDRFIYVSPACTSIWGVTPEEAYADAGNVWRAVHPHDVATHRGDVAEHLAGPEARKTYEYRIVKPDGEIRWIQATLIKGVAATGSVLLHGVAVDKTDQRRAVELKVANDALARAAVLKDEFLASMSHELRTPLTSILGLTEALGEGVYGELETMQKRSLQTIGSSARHLLELINDILDLSKVEAGMLDLHRESVPVAPMCEMALLFVKSIAYKKRIRLTFTADPHAQFVRADPRRLKQILVNLLGNAVKFTPDSGSVGLEVSADATAGLLRFAVWDTGIGISPEDQPRLFQPFVQVSAGRTKQFVGTGLGLSLVRKMTELHGGRVGVDSKPGSGARFTVELPWDAGAKKSDPGIVTTPSPALDGRGLRVLLAEDSEPVVRMVSDYLRGRGYEVTIARNGHLAVELAFETRPDIILMDGHMPGMNGIDAIKLLRDHPITAPVPILAVTAQAMAGDREKLLEAGATDYLSKPFTLRALTAKVAQLLHAKPTAHPE